MKKMFLISILVIPMIACSATKEVSILGATDLDKKVLVRWELAYDAILRIPENGLSDTAKKEWAVIKGMDLDEKIVVFRLILPTITDPDTYNYIVNGYPVPGFPPLPDELKSSIFEFH